MKARRKSKQRERIYELILNTHNHPTAQWVYDTLRKEISPISLGNVYRNLNILVEEGRITKSEYGDSVEHFDASTHVHYHFICSECGNVYDIDEPEIEQKIEEFAQEQMEHTVESHRIDFYGICKECSVKAGKKTG